MVAGQQCNQYFDTIDVQNITHVAAVSELVAEEKSRQRVMEKMRDIDDKQQPTIDRRGAMSEADGAGVDNESRWRAIE